MRFPREFTLFGVSGATLVGGWLIHSFEGPAWLRIACLGLSALCSSTHTFPEALRLLRKFSLDIDVLMFAAAIGAASLGHYEEGALLLFLFGLGNAGETLAVGRSRRAIEALTSLAPDAAVRMDDAGVETLTPLGELRVGDRVLIKPFDRIGVDATIDEGTSDIDESSLTGESLAVTKRADDSIFAGTLNGAGRLVVSVTRGASDSTLSRIVRLVEDAQSQRSPTQLFADRVEHIYVPWVFAVTLALIFAPPLLGFSPRMDPSSKWGGWFYQAMAFLTAASPCALAIGTPTAVLCGIARAARMGVLIKGGAHLETLGRLRAIAFDKTGTLTMGKPSVERVETIDRVSRADALTLAAAVDVHVSHPFAASLVEAASKNGPLPAATDVRQIPGEGVEGRVNGNRIGVGKGRADALPMRLSGAFAEMQANGLATAVVTRDGETIAVVGLLDRPRDTAAETITRLRAAGIGSIDMLTGDHAAVARLVGARLGIDAEHVHADLSPQAKLERIDALVLQHQYVAMIGDGVNDAPALAKASLGIAMGAASAGKHAASDVAIETADVVLMGSDLRRVADAVMLARRADRIITQNLVLALGVICIVAPLAALGFARLGWAVLLHEGSTIVVVVNALRLLRR